MEGPLFLVIGAGLRGTAYASAVRREGLLAIIAAVAEPIRSTRISFGKNYVWEGGAPREYQTFDSWQHFFYYERNRREAEAAGEKVYAGIYGIIVCTQDHAHKEILQAFGPLKLHTFLTGHALRYSPHNMLLRRLLLEDRAIGEVISVEHTEPESVAAPSLLCMSCHDIDFILWLLCCRIDFGESAHMPSLVSSAGNQSLFTKHRKLAKLYVEKLYGKRERDWPICFVVPVIEDITATSGTDHGRAVLTEWYGRCACESDNDVLDDQIVTLTWDDDSRAVSGEEFPGRGPKTVVFYMASFTEAQSKRQGKISGTHREIQYDSDEIRVYTFDKFRDPEAAKVFTPPKAGGGHDGGDGGLMNGFSQAVDAVINGKLNVEQAQAKHVGCTLKEAFMSHAMVFAAEEARLGRKIIDWMIGGRSWRNGSLPSELGGRF
ncbi:streptomycin biosynthesis protein StrI [Lasiosphaeria hispida]|uniref:Streptomycin biosynthesis protein StrI n=1 Tax=Lasiosphaeria hispida TaxID=260671 RepID=A0AAJ0H563_9PEZI|nr:streptomycin biosynthesis protein StrI [Lasiosphaeria hispida]KAK3338620.1 streptomycin biosynthesis protein StrI [Lasiosphaeria hispida]